MLFIQIDSSENWEPASISLRRSGYQIKMGNTEAVVIAEKYSRELSVCALVRSQLTDDGT